MASSDQQLIEQIREGKQQALLQFYAKKRVQLLAIIRQNMNARLAGKVDPQDILQDTLIHALDAFASTDLQHISPFTWLCRLADQRIIDAHRRFFGARKRNADLEVDLYQPCSPEQSIALIDMLASSVTTPSQVVHRDQKIQVFQEQFEQLSESLRDAIKLRYIDGLSLQEIAQKLDKSEGSIRVMLSRGVKKLRTSLA